MTADHQRHLQARRSDGSDVFEYQSYGGWLTDSAFSVDLLTINDGSNESSLLVGINYGEESGSRPTGTGRAVWSGLAFGIFNRDGVIGAFGAMRQ